MARRSRRMEPDCQLSSTAPSRSSIARARGYASKHARTIDGGRRHPHAPTSLIAAQTIRVSSGLADKVNAASGLPLGLADKLVMTIDAPEMLPVDGHLFGDPNRTATGSYHLRPFGRPLIEGYFGGVLRMS